jgi:hypothetical protein
MLLDRDADIDAHGGYYGSAVEAAFYNGHERVAQMTLDQNADFDAQDEALGTP